jgi:hypothetical protein
MLSGMPHPLDGCWEKIKRANQHIREIHDDIVVKRVVRVPNDPIRCEDNFHARDLQTSPIHSRELIFRLRETPDPLPLSFTILAGEAVHHLRSVLDHLVYQLVIIKTKKPPTFNSAFPIVGRGRMKKTGWVSASDEYEAQTSRLKQVISDTAEATIKSLQPLQRGSAYADDPLWILSELDNAYKHRLLLLTVHGVSRYSGTITDSGHTIAVDFAPRIAYERGAELGRIALPPERFNGEVQVDGDLILDVAFDEILGRKYVAVIPQLAQLSAYVAEIISNFKGEFR